MINRAFFIVMAGVAVVWLISAAWWIWYRPIQDLSKITSGHDNVRLEPPPQEIICFPDGTGTGVGYRDFREDIKRLCGKR